MSNTQRLIMDSPIASADKRVSDGTQFFGYVAIVIVALYVSNINDFFYGKGSPFKPLYFHLLTVGLAGLALLTQEKTYIYKLSKPVMVWTGLFLALLLIGFLLSSQSDVVIEQFIYGLETVALMFAFLVLLATGRPKALLNTLVIIVLISVCLNLYDFVSPSFSTTYGRSAGLHGNANNAGKTIAMAMVLGCLAVPKKLRLAFCMFAGVGILVTFSRSSWLLWVIGMTGLGLTGQVFFRSKIASVVVLSTVGLLAVYALLSGTMLGWFESMGFDEFLTGGTVSRLGGGGAAFQDASATGRIGAIWHSLSEFQKHPWFGGGLGTTAEWVSMNRPHNLYLMYAVDAGILGLLLIFALVGILWSQVNSIGRVAVLLYAVSSVFTHNNLEHAHMLCLIAIMIVAYPRRDWLPGESVHYAGNRFH